MRLILKLTTLTKSDFHSSKEPRVSRTRMWLGLRIKVVAPLWKHFLQFHRNVIDLNY